MTDKSKNNLVKVFERYGLTPSSKYYKECVKYFAGMSIIHHILTSQKGQEAK